MSIWAELLAEGDLVGMAAVLAVVSKAGWWAPVPAWRADTDRGRALDGCGSRGTGVLEALDEAGVPVSASSGELCCAA